MNLGSYFYRSSEQTPDSVPIEKKRFDYIPDDSVVYSIRDNINYRHVTDSRGVGYYMLEEDLDSYEESEKIRKDLQNKNILLPVIQVNKDSKVQSIFPEWENPMPAGFLSIEESKQIINLTMRIFEEGYNFKSFHKDIFKKSHDVYHIFDVSTLNKWENDESYESIEAELDKLFNDYDGFVHVPDHYLSDTIRVEQYFQRNQINDLDTLVMEDPGKYSIDFWSRTLNLPVDESASNIYLHVLANYLDFDANNITDDFYVGFPGESFQTLQNRLQAMEEVGLGGTRNLDIFYSQVSNYNLENIKYMLTKFRRPPKISNLLVQRIRDAMYTAVFEKQLLQSPMIVMDNVDSEIESLFVTLMETLNLEFVSNDVKNNLVTELSNRFPDLVTYLQSL